MSTTFTLTVEHDSGRVERWTGTVQSLGYDSGEPFSRIEVTSADMRAVRNLVSSRVDTLDAARERDQRKAKNHPDRCQDCEWIDACQCAGQWAAL